MTNKEAVQPDVPDTNVGDMISRREAIDAIESCEPGEERFMITSLPSAQPKLSCEGCKHLGKWENEVEYGYSSPCTRCKRRVEDHYER